MLGAEVIRTIQQGAPRIDLRLGVANIFIAPVKHGDGTNSAPTIPHRGLDHFGLSVSGIDAIAADLRAKGVEFTREPTTVRQSTTSGTKPNIVGRPARPGGRALCLLNKGLHPG